MRRFALTFGLLFMISVSASAADMSCFNAIRDESRYGALLNKIAWDSEQASFAQLEDDSFVSDEERLLVESMAQELKGCTREMLNAGPPGPDRTVFITTSNNRDRLYFALYSRRVTFGQFNSLRADSSRAAREQYAQNQSQSMQQVNNAILQVLAAQPAPAAPRLTPYFTPVEPTAAPVTTQCRWVGQVWTCN